MMRFRAAIERLTPVEDPSATSPKHPGRTADGTCRPDLAPHLRRRFGGSHASRQFACGCEQRDALTRSCSSTGSAGPSARHELFFSAGISMAEVPRVSRTTSSSSPTTLMNRSTTSCRGCHPSSTGAPLDRGRQRLIWSRIQRWAYRSGLCRAVGWFGPCRWIRCDRLNLRRAIPFCGQLPIGRECLNNLPNSPPGQQAQRLGPNAWSRRTDLVVALRRQCRQTRPIRDPCREPTITSNPMTSSGLANNHLMMPLNPRIWNEVYGFVAS